MTCGGLLIRSLSKWLILLGLHLEHLDIAKLISRFGFKTISVRKGCCTSLSSIVHKILGRGARSIDIECSLSFSQIDLQVLTEED